MYCYNVSLTSAVFYSLMLDVLSVIGEYAALYILGIKYIPHWTTLTFYQSIAMTIGGKLIYLIGIVFLKRFAITKAIYDNESEIILAIIPTLTIVCLTVMMRFDVDEYFLLNCIVFLSINFITFYINAKLNEKNRKLRLLQEEYNQNKTELSEYQLISEKYENTKIMCHDFHKQLNVLKDLIATDNTEAKEYVQQIQFSQRELSYIKYTDNKILNILFAQKIRECHERNIEIHIHSTAPTLSFISDIDTVAIFSNMLDNAIEASEQSEKKEIFVDLYTVNNSYSAVKVENHTDNEPIILDGVLRTQKKNSDIHGIGIKSINNALKKYNSELTWSYDKKNKFFKAAVLIHVPRPNSI